MSDIKKQIAELETQTAEVALIASLATDPKARVKSARLAEELDAALVKLRNGTADKDFLLQAAKTCRTLATETGDMMMKFNLELLALNFETKALDPE